MSLRDYFNFNRRDSGWLRLALSIVFTIVTLFFLYVGYLLFKSGITGNWQILSTFKGWSLYIAGTSPGLLVIAIGAVILSYALPKVLKSL